MKNKILAFVYDGDNFLALRNNAADSVHGGDYWFTVTGSMEGRESYGDAVYREVKEETGLIVKDTFDLNCGSIYSWAGKDYSERNFLAFVLKGDVKLSVEHVDFNWLSLKRFVRRINPRFNNPNLGSILEKSLKGQLFFNEVKMEDFRRKLIC